jgi:hypothetical protein
VEAASTSLPINRFEISVLQDVSGKYRNAREALTGGRQQHPTVSRKALPGATPTQTDHHIPMILPILRCVGRVGVTFEPLRSAHKAIPEAGMSGYPRSTSKFGSTYFAVPVRLPLTLTPAICRQRFPRPRGDSMSANVRPRFSINSLILATAAALPRRQPHQCRPVRKAVPGAELPACVFAVGVSVRPANDALVAKIHQLRTGTFLLMIGTMVPAPLPPR